jgi:hypothetical protein
MCQEDSGGVVAGRSQKHAVFISAVVLQNVNLVAAAKGEKICVLSIDEYSDPPESGRTSQRELYI